MKASVEQRSAYYQMEVTRFALAQFDLSVGKIEHPSAKEACETIGERTYLKLSLASITRRVLDTGVKLDFTDRIKETLKIIHEKTILDEIKSGNYIDAKKYYEEDYDEMYIFDPKIAQGMLQVLGALPRSDYFRIGTHKYTPPSILPALNRDIINAYEKSKSRNKKVA